MALASQRQSYQKAKLNLRWYLKPSGEQTLAKPNEMVNIERSLRVGDRLEGHFVLGHVDGTGVIEDIQKMSSETTIWIKLDKWLAKALVPKGSIAVDGVSLTLVGVEGDRVSVSLIPHTLKVTTLGIKRRGNRVNIETDILGKYVISNLPKP